MDKVLSFMSSAMWLLDACPSQLVHEVCVCLCMINSSISHCGKERFLVALKEAVAYLSLKRPSLDPVMLKKKKQPLTTLQSSFCEGCWDSGGKLTLQHLSGIILFSWASGLALFILLGDLCCDLNKRNEPKLTLIDLSITFNTFNCGILFDCLGRMGFEMISLLPWWTILIYITREGEVAC